MTRLLLAGRLAWTPSCPFPGTLTVSQHNIPSTFALAVAAPSSGTTAGMFVVAWPGLVPDDLAGGESCGHRQSGKGARDGLWPGRIEVSAAMK